MPPAKTKDEFLLAWNEHIDQLSYLLHSLPHSYFDKLKELQTELKSLVIVARDNTYSVDGVKRK